MKLKYSRIAEFSIFWDPELQEVRDQFSIDHSHLLKHIVHHSKILSEKEREKIRQRLNGKLEKWSYRQDTPLCKVNGTIKFLGEITRPPDYVIETLKLGPRNPILETFDDKEIFRNMTISDHVILKSKIFN